jgi:hypothetical protein
MSTPLKAIYRFNTIPSECKCHFPQKWKNQSKNHMEVQKTQMAEAYPKQKRAMLGVSQYLISNYTTEPKQ